MFSFLTQWEERSRAWVERNAESKKADALLGVVSFAEASFFPIPPSILLLALIVVTKGKRWIYYATLTTVTSVLGGLFGYLIGSVLYDSLGVWLIETYGLTETIATSQELFARHAFWANVIAAFTPIPYKAFTIASGFFAINPLTFVFAALLGRGLRFYIVAYLAKLFGEHVADKILKYATLLTLASVIILILFVIVH